MQTGRISCRADPMSDDILPIPTHIAVIMDGNGRWAVQRGVPRHYGHREGGRAVREVVRGCRAMGVRYLTLYAFSTANWKRPRIEVTALMRLLVRFARREVDELIERGISVGMIGRKEDLPAVTRRALDELMERTKGGTEMRLTLALSYGGRSDLVHAAREAVREAGEGKLRPEELDERWLRGRLWAGGLPDPDLLIRTGGEQRLSDFLPYEAVYAEMVFLDTLWPDFDRRELWRAIQIYQDRDRRFGGAVDTPGPA